MQKFMTTTASDEFTTARVVAAPTPSEPPNVLSPGLAADDGDGRTVGQALREPDADVGNADAFQVEKGARADVEVDLGGQHARAHGHARGTHHEQQGHHQASQETRLHQLVYRVGGTHAQRVDLFGDHHRADLGGNSGADARRQHQGTDGRAQVFDDEFDERGAQT
jgi:hypothetical protein